MKFARFMLLQEFKNNREHDQVPEILVHKEGE